jgi:hypothetical protein
MGLTATIVHMFLWNFDDIKAGWSFLHPTQLKKLLQPSFWIFWKGGKTQEEHKREVLENPDMDPHYKMMVQEGYSEVPNWWYGLVLLGSFVVGLGTLYGIGSTLPWWGYIISNLFALLFILFFGAQYGLTGFQFNQQPIIQMVAGYIHPVRFILPLISRFHRCRALETYLGSSVAPQLIKRALETHTNPSTGQTLSKHVLHSLRLQWCPTRPMALP